MAIDLWLPLAFFLIALVYSTAGFGGGSSYLALLGLSGLPVSAMRPLALICNLIVTGASSLRYARAGLIPWRRALPLVLASVPAAYLGGRVDLPRAEYLLLLGILLVLAGIGMLITPQRKEHSTRHRTAFPPALLWLVGGGIGFLAGLVGIGGGVFLSPLLFLTHWAAPRQIAATTSLFIAVNSLAGLAGQLTNGLSLPLPSVLPLALAVALGGLLGTRLTIHRLPPATIRKIAGLLILLVGLRLLFITP